MELLGYIRKYLHKSRVPEVGNSEAICPYCGKMLRKKPSRKKKCPHCKSLIYIRIRPKDGIRVLVTKDQVNLIEVQWSVTGCADSEYPAERQVTQNERAALARRLGCEPSDSDVKWSVLDKESSEHAKKGNLELYRNTKFAMAELLRKEAKHKPALSAYLEVLYLDLNGPKNTGRIKSPGVLRELPPFSQKDACVAPAVIDRAVGLMKKLEFKTDDTAKLFDKMAQRSFKNLNLPVRPEQAWKKITKDLFSCTEKL